MQNPIRPPMSGKRKKQQQWISTLHQELLKGLNLPLIVHLLGKKSRLKSRYGYWEIFFFFFMMHAFLPML